jgi:hypothetical protein
MKRRKLTPEEREHRRHERSAARKNAKLKAEVPLFADQLPQHTAEGEYWHWRFNKATAAERCAHVEGLQLLDVLRLLAIRTYALKVAGKEAFAKLDAYCRRTYPPGHWYGFWCRVLTGERIEFGFRRVEDRGDGQPAVVCTDWYERRHLSREEFDARFPFKDPEPAPVDDGGLAAHVDAVLARLARERELH